MMYVLLDLDHTVSNAFWRDSMIGVESWDKYHEESQHDKPFKNVANLINSLASVGYVIIGITGRNEKFRQLTTNWLLKHRIDVDELLMRPDGNFEKNGIVKIKLIDDRFKKNYKEIQFLIDDNEDTILEFFKLGIATLQVRHIREVSNGHDQPSKSANEQNGNTRTDNGSGNIAKSDENNGTEQRNLQELS
jgi:hypothetical protein